MENILLPGISDIFITLIYVASGLLFLIAAIMLLVDFTKTNNTKHLLVMLLVIFLIPIIGPIYYIIRGRKKIRNDFR